MAIKNENGHYAISINGRLKVFETINNTQVYRFDEILYSEDDKIAEIHFTKIFFAYISVTQSIALTKLNIGEYCEFEMLEYNYSQDVDSDDPPLFPPPLVRGNMEIPVIYYTSEFMEAQQILFQS